MTTSLSPPHVEDVKAALRKRGTSLSQVARDEGVSPQAVSAVLYGRSSSQRIEVALAEASGFSLEEIQSISAGADTQSVSESVSESVSAAKRPTRSVFGGETNSGVGQ